MRSRALQVNLVLYNLLYNTNFEKTKQLMISGKTEDLSYRIRSCRSYKYLAALILAKGGSKTSHK